MVGAAAHGLGEEQDGGADARIGLEHAAGQADDGIQLLFFHQQAAQLPVRLAAAKQHAVGHDDGGAPAGLEQAQEQGQEQQLGLPGLDDGQQVLGGVLVVQTAGKGRVGQDEAVGAGVARAALREGIAVFDGRVFHAVQHHVHAADAQHGVVEIEAMEHGVVEVPVLRRHAQHVGVGGAQVVAGGHQVAAGATGRVADGVLRGGGGERHHQLDDVARGAELPVLPGRGDLAEHVFIQVALGVAVVERNAVEQIDHLAQQVGRGDGEARVAHVAGKGRFGRRAAGGVQAAQEGEDVLAEHLEHLLRPDVLEVRPAHLRVGQAALVAARRVDAHGLGLEAGGLVVFAGLVGIQRAQEKQVGDLLDHLQRVGDAARPEGVPDLVDAVAEFTGKHGSGRGAGSRWKWRCRRRRRPMAARRDVDGTLNPCSDCF